jgi:hypothetical protein
VLLLGCSRAVLKLNWLSTAVEEAAEDCSAADQPFRSAAAGVTSGIGIYIGLSGPVNEPAPAEGIPQEEGAGLKFDPL